MLFLCTIIYIYIHYFIYSFVEKFVCNDSKLNRWSWVRAPGQVYEPGQPTELSPIFENLRRLHHRQLCARPGRRHVDARRDAKGRAMTHNDAQCVNGYLAGFLKAKIRVWKIFLGKFSTDDTLCVIVRHPWRTVRP